MAKKENEVGLAGFECTFKPPAGSPVNCPARRGLLWTMESGDEDGPHGVPQRMAQEVVQECTYKQKCPFKKRVRIFVRVEHE